MKFCDKLAKQRKNNNLSQEQLADKLNVSRQAVSKWESASSYPDMEKIIQMTKILNCTLEDLLDDGTINSTNSSNKLNFNSYMQEFLAFITKTYNMFCSMNLKEKLKCIMEMSLLVIILIVSSAIIDSVIDSLILDWFTKIPIIGFELKNILFNLIIIISLIISIIIFIHLFKIRYLDYFVTIEDSNVAQKTIEEPFDKETEKKYIYEKAKKEKIIIRDPKHSSMSFYNLLIKIIILILKFFACIFIVPIVVIFVSLIMVGVISLYHAIYAVIFLLIAIGLIGAVLLTYCLIEFLYNFITNKEIKFKKIFIISILSLIIIGISTGLTVINLLDYNYIEGIDKLELVTKTEYIDIDANTIIFPDPDIENKYYNNQYIIDNTIEDKKVKIEINTPKGAKYTIEEYNDRKFEIYHIHTSYDINFKGVYDLIINDIKNNVIRDYQYSAQTRMYLSQNTYDLLQNNYDEYKRFYENEEENY